MSDRHYREYGFVIGYMCLADYEELGMADDGNKVFPSVEDLKRGRPCVEGCGIVQVRVTATKIIQEPKWVTTMEYDLPADDLVEDIFNLFDRHNASLEQQVGALMISISSVLAHFDDKDAELNVVCDGIRQMTNDIEIEYDD